MASYISELDFPNFVQYYLTLYSSDYDMASTYGEPLPFSQEEFGFFRVGNELAPTKLEACEWNLLPYDGTGNWLGMYESYLDGYWEKDRLSNGFDVDTFNNADGSGWEKAEAAYLGEEHRGHYCSYNASDFSSWSGDEYGGEDNFLDDNTDGVNTSYGFNWDEMKLCESIFGGWPLFVKAKPGELC